MFVLALAFPPGAATDPQLDAAAYPPPVSWRQDGSNDSKGGGFIETEHGGVFVYRSATQSQGFRSLREGQEVGLELGQGGKGPRAAKVRPR